MAGTGDSGDGGVGGAGSSAAAPAAAVDASAAARAFAGGMITHIPLPGKDAEASGKLYRCCMPYCSYDEGGVVFDTLRELNGEGKQLLVVMVVPDDEAQRKSGREFLRGEYEAAGFDVAQVDIGAYDSSDAAKLVPVVSAAKVALASGRPVAVHCGSGLGRACAVASLIVASASSVSGDDAVAWVREHVPDERTLAKETTRAFVGRWASAIADGSATLDESAGGSAGSGAT